MIMEMRKDTVKRQKMAGDSQRLATPYSYSQFCDLYRLQTRWTDPWQVHLAGRRSHRLLRQEAAHLETAARARPLRSSCSWRCWALQLHLCRGHAHPALADFCASTVLASSSSDAHPGSLCPINFVARVSGPDPTTLRSTRPTRSCLCITTWPSFPRRTGERRQGQSRDRQSVIAQRWIIACLPQPHLLQPRRPQPRPSPSC